MEKKNVVFTKDGAKVAVKEVKTEDYAEGVCEDLECSAGGGGGEEAGGGEVEDEVGGVW